MGNWIKVGGLLIVRWAVRQRGSDICPHRLRILRDTKLQSKGKRALLRSMSLNLPIADSGRQATRFLEVIMPPFPPHSVFREPSRGVVRGRSPKTNRYLCFLFPSCVLGRHKAINATLFALKMWGRIGSGGVARIPRRSLHLPKLFELGFVVFSQGHLHEMLLAFASNPSGACDPRSGGSFSHLWSSLCPLTPLVSSESTKSTPFSRRLLLQESDAKRKAWNRGSEGWLEARWLW